MDTGNWVTWVGHTLSGIAIVGTIFNWFPEFAAALAAAWYCIQLYESRTIQNFLALRRVKKIAVLKAELLKLEELHREKESHKKQ